MYVFDRAGQELLARQAAGRGHNLQQELALSRTVVLWRRRAPVWEAERI
ncbi:hypothetical protein ACFYYI_42770 [Streptomyces sp. NPDC002387]